MRAMVYLPESVWESIFVRMIAGQSLLSIVKEDDSLPSHMTLYRIMERDDKVKAAYQKAVEMRAEVLAEDILTLADEEIPAFCQSQYLIQDRSEW